MPDKMGATPQWVVSHCGARDRYQLPIALHEVGQLYRFVTDFYSPLDSPILGNLLKHAPLRLRSKLMRRYRDGLPSKFANDQKLTEAFKWIRTPVARDFELARMVSERAARIASDSGSSLLITSYNGWAAFPLLSKNTRKVLFQVHPHPWFLRDLYRSMEHEMNDGDGFLCESEMMVTDELLKRWGQESLDADIVVAASSFTRKSLLHVGVRPERIHVVPYGVDSRVFRNDVAFPIGKPKVLFVGQHTSRKGFRNLLDVWERLDNHHAELHITSGSCSSLPETRSGGPVVWHERLAVTGLVELMNQSDLLVLPSVAEGFGMVLLEALSCGTPVLCSDATAGPDLLKGWDERFLFTAGDWDGFALRLDYWLNNVGCLRKMRSSARNLAENQTWEKFRSNLRRACNSNVNSVHQS